MILTPPTLDDYARWRGLRIGLMGGSFNPPHYGHLHLAETARHYMKLDAVWWLVTPHNPLKDSANLAGYKERLRLCRELTHDRPQNIVTDIEYRLGTNRTYDTLTALLGVYNDTDFVMVTGMDNALTLHEWYRWQDLLGLVATAHVARPPATRVDIADCPLRRLASQNHIVVKEPSAYPLIPRHTYWLVDVAVVDMSSTKIRNNNRLK